MLFLFIVPNIYVVGALLAIISNTAFGASFVLLNSFLPVLIRRHPSIQKPAAEGQTRYHEDRRRYGNAVSGESEIESSTDSPLLSTDADQSLSSHSTKASSISALELSTKISSQGIGIGYIAAVIVQILGISIVLVASPLTNSSTLILRIVLFIIGLWWFVFSVPAALWLRPRPGPPLPCSSSGKDTWTRYLTHAWAGLFKTILRARRLKDIMLFLSAWFLLSDSIATVSGTAILFAKTDLHVGPFKSLG